MSKKLPGSFASSGPLHLTARRAYQRTSQVPGDRHHEAGSDAWIAIVFSAISVEAFLNEIPIVLLFATSVVGDEDARERLKSYQKMLEIDAVGSALTIRAKYILAAHAFRVGTRAAALWACNAAANAVNSILDSLGDEQWKTAANFYRFDRADEPL